MNPLDKRQMLIEKFKSKPKPEKLIKAKDLKLDFLPETFEWYRKKEGLIE